MKRSPKWVRKHTKRVPARASGHLRFRVFHESDDLSGPLGVVHIALPPGKGHAPIRHRRTHEWVYVLTGRASARLDGRKVDLEPGAYLYLPPGVWHEFRARGSGVTALSLFSPPLDWKKPDIEMKKESP